MLIQVFWLLSMLTMAQNMKTPSYIVAERKASINKMKFNPSTETNNFDILYHRIFWDLDPEKYYIKGAVTSYFKALENNFSMVHFDLINGINIDSIVQNGAHLPFKHSNNLIAIDLPVPINKGNTDSLTIYYQGEPQAISGFTSFDTAYHNNVASLWTLSEPYGAREWWPCKQSLTDKIDSIDIFVRSPNGNKVASNGKLMYEKFDDTTTLTYWKHRYPIASYLVAVAITNYVSYSHYANIKENTQVEILNYVYPEDKERAMEDTKFTIDAIELFSNLFIPYPFYKEKYGHAQFKWHGGMEHQTMSFMIHFNEDLITHELAHQWFGDYVTCKSWKDIWINEGFAVFCESLAQENLFPDNWTKWKKGRMDYIVKYAEKGSVYVDDTTDVSRIFSRALTYEKGGAILQLLRTQVGDQAFFNGIRNYLNDAKISNGFATGNDFKKFIEQTADTNLTPFFNDWYYGQGYPKYQINWEQAINNNLRIYISQSTTHESVPFFKLKIPLLLKGENKELIVVINNTKNNQEISLTPDFTIEQIIFDPNYNIIAPHPATVNRIINETAFPDGIYILPNPAKEMVYVKSDKGRVFNKVDVINISGRQLTTMTFKNYITKTEIDISKFPVGVYFIRIETTKGMVVREFVKSE